MIITSRFVYIHQPKTGGTFVSEMLRRLHDQRCRANPLRRWFPRLCGELFMDVKKHGTCGDIPAAHRDKPVLATIRNPYDRYVSQFEFAWWKHHEENLQCNVADLRRRCPSYPELTFNEFVEVATMMYQRLPASPLSPVDRPGFQSEQLVRYFFRDPERVFVRVDEAYIRERRFAEDMYPVRFLHTDKLNEELYRALVDLGYKPGAVGFIRTSDKIHPPEGGRSDDQRWERYYTPELKARVRHMERLVFAMFPEFDV